MVGTGKFRDVVKATSHMRAESGAGERCPDEPQPSTTGDPPKRPPGRPRSGKRSDPGFRQVTTLLPSDLYARVKVRLIEDKSRSDFSELVRGLLENWLLAGGRGPHERS